MSKLKAFFGSMLVSLVLFCLPGSLVKSAGPNLIANPSMETASGGSPAGWLQEKWGTSTAAFSYATSGYASLRSLKVTVSAYSSGDAKWYFTPVNVSPSTEYTFSNWYMSSVQTSIVAMSLDAQGNPTYFDVAVSVPISATWKNSNYKVKTLANTKTLTIFHLIKKNGWLQVDDYSLSSNAVSPAPSPTPTPTPSPSPSPTPTPPSPPQTNLVPNASLETSSSNPSLPNKWSQEKWGTNSPIYEYLSNGHTGSRSVKVTMANYSSGDAKWMFNHLPLERGKDYKFTAWYKTNTIPHVVVEYIKDDGTEDYFGMRDPQPTGTDWQKYSDTFYVPANVKSVSVFFFLTNNGWVQTDDYEIVPFTYSPFNRGLVTLTFDDGFEENVSTVLPVLDQYGFKATQCDATQYVEGIQAQEQIAKTFVAHGHEMCSHTVTHPMLTQVSTSTLTYELTHSKQFLQQLTGQPVTNFSTPFGDYNTSVNNEIKKYYLSHRTTDEGFNAKDNFDPYRLKVQNMQSNTTLAQFQQWVSKAKADKTWLILIYHVVKSNGLEEFDTKKSDFDAQMQWLSQSGVSVQRWDKAFAEVKAQVP